MAMAVSFPLLFIFSLTTPIFSHSFVFPIKLLLSRLRPLPSLSQGREQGHAAAILLLSCVEKAVTMAVS
jgi:hypothetical protein